MLNTTIKYRNFHFKIMSQNLSNKVSGLKLTRFELRLMVSMFGMFD